MIVSVRVGLIVVATAVCVLSPVLGAPPLPDLYINETEHMEGDTSSMFPIVRAMLSDDVNEQFASQNAYSRVFTRSDGSVCSDPGNAFWNKNDLFSSPTEDGHSDKVMRWQPTDTKCSLRYEGVDFRKELANKTILFIGNSVSRGTFWQLASLIEHNGEVVPVNREMQKAACSKTSSQHVSCHLSPPDVPRMYFSWIQELDDLTRRVSAVKETLKREADIVVFNLGLQHLIFGKDTTRAKLLKYLPAVIDEFRKHMPNARLVYLPVSPANENNERVRGRFHLDNLKIMNWDVEAFEIIQQKQIEWLPVCEPVMRGWLQQLRYDQYGYVDHFHPSAHVYSLWARMLMSVLQQPPRPVPSA